VLEKLGVGVGELDMLALGDADADGELDADTVGEPVDAGGELLEQPATVSAAAAATARRQFTRLTLLVRQAVATSLSS
jgi:hypothetical protein